MNENDLLNLIGIIFICTLPLWATILLKVYSKFKDIDYSRHFRTFIELRPYWVLVGLLLFFSTIESSFIEPLVNPIAYDASPAFYNIEGDSTSVFQDFTTPATNFIFSAIYTVGFTGMLILPLFYLSIKGEKKFVKALAYGFLIIYLIGLPFYLFFKVYEPWSLNPTYNLGYGNYTHIRGILYADTLHSEVNIIHEINGLNNCFPSLHTANVIFLSLLFFKYAKRTPKYIIYAFSVLVIFSIFYLGIHWYIDFVAGLITAYAGYRIAFWAENKFDIDVHFRPVIRRSR